MSILRLPCMMCAITCVCLRVLPFGGEGGGEEKRKKGYEWCASSCVYVSVSVSILLSRLGRILDRI